MAWIWHYCVLPGPTGAEQPLPSKPEESSQREAGDVGKASWEGCHPRKEEVTTPAVGAEALL